jgi:GNAT superfamily N-acetyltransferase
VRVALDGGYELDDDRSRIDFEVVHAYIHDISYWAKGRSRERMRAALEGTTRVIGVYAPDGAQVGFCRVVSDNATFAYLADVFVLEPHRGRGLGVEMLREAFEREPWLHCSWHLKTADAHALYERFGFVPSGELALDRKAL